SEPWAPDSTAIDYLIGLLFVGRWVIFYWLLLALAVFDAENLWLPDRITLPGIALGFIISLVTIVCIARGPATDAFENVRFGAFGAAFERLAGILVAAGLILLIRWVYWLVRKQEGMGLGDAKLMALLAA